MEKHEILLVDDDPNILEVTGWALKDQGYQVTPATGGETALELLNAKHFDLVMTDLNLGEGDGLAILRASQGEVARDSSHNMHRRYRRGSCRRGPSIGGG